VGNNLGGDASDEGGAHLEVRPELPVVILRHGHSVLQPMSAGAARARSVRALLPPGEGQGKPLSCGDPSGAGIQDVRGQKPLSWEQIYPKYSYIGSTTDVAACAGGGNGQKKWEGVEGRGEEKGSHLCGRLPPQVGRRARKHVEPRKISRKGPVGGSVGPQQRGSRNGCPPPGAAPAPSNGRSFRSVTERFIRRDGRIGRPDRSRGPGAPGKVKTETVKLPTVPIPFGKTASGRYSRGPLVCPEIRAAPPGGAGRVPGLTKGTETGRETRPHSLDLGSGGSKGTDVRGRAGGGGTRQREGALRSAPPPRFGQKSC